MLNGRTATTVSIPIKNKQCNEFIYYLIQAEKTHYCTKELFEQNVAVFGSSRP